MDHEDDIHAGNESKTRSHSFTNLPTAHSTLYGGLDDVGHLVSAREGMPSIIALSGILTSDECTDSGLAPPLSGDADDYDADADGESAVSEDGAESVDSWVGSPEDKDKVLDINEMCKSILMTVIKNVEDTTNADVPPASNKKEKPKVILAEVTGEMITGQKVSFSVYSPKQYSMQAFLEHFYGHQSIPLGQHFSYLVELDIVGVSMRGTPHPSQLSLFTDIRRLSLRHVGPSKSYKELATLSSLSHLDLSGNKITTVPLELSGLPNLKVLILDNNRLKGLWPAESYTFNKLEVLSLNDNPSFNGFLPEFQRFMALTELNCAGTNLKSLQEFVISASVVPLSKFNIAGTRLSSSTLLSQCLKYMTTSETLSHLNLSGCGISSLGKEVLAVGCPNLTHVFLAKNSLKVVPFFLQFCTSLQELDLSENKLSALVLDHTTKEQLSLFQLERLLLHHNSITSFYGYLHDFPSLTHLDLSYNELSAFPDGLESVPELKVLDLSHNSKLNIPPIELAYLVHLEQLSMNNFGIKCCRNTDATIEEGGGFVTVEGQSLQGTLETLADDSLDGTTPSKKTSEKEKKTSSLELQCLLDVSRAAPHPIFSWALLALSESSPVLMVKPLLQHSGIFLLLEYASSKHHRMEADAIAALNNLAAISHDVQVEIVKSGGWPVAFKLASAAVPSESSVPALSLLEKVSFNQQLMASLKSMHALSDVFKSWGVLYPSLPTETARLAGLLHLFGNFAFDTEQRALIEENAALIEKVRLLRDHGDRRLAREARRLLAILGCNDLDKCVTDNRGVRVLCMDGGGSRGLVCLTFLARLEKMTGRRVSDLFDLVVGTSTGGIVAFSLGLVKLSVEDTTRLYRQLLAEIFAGSEKQGGFAKIVSIFGNSDLSRYNVETLETQLKKHTPNVSMIDTQMDPGALKVCAIATLVSQTPAEPYVMRNYEHPTGHSSRYLGSSRLKPWQALRASSAAPSYFPEMDYGRRPFKMRFQDGGCYANNPAGIAVHEARRIWGNRPIDCVLSLGTGRTEVERSVYSRRLLTRILNTLVESATDVDRVHHCLLDTMPQGTYFRFQPIGKDFGMELDETDVKVLDSLEAATNKYIDEHMDDFTALCQALLGKKEKVSARAHGHSRNHSVPVNV